MLKHIGDFTLVLTSTLSECFNDDSVGFCTQITYCILQPAFSTSQLKSNQEPDAKIHNMTKILKNSQRAVLSWILVSGSWLLLSRKYGLEGTSARKEGDSLYVRRDGISILKRTKMTCNFGWNLVWGMMIAIFRYHIATTRYQNCYD